MKCSGWLFETVSASIVSCGYGIVVWEFPPKISLVALVGSIFVTFWQAGSWPQIISAEVAWNWKMNYENIFFLTFGKIVVSCLGIVPGLFQLGWSFCTFLVHSSFEVREGHFFMLGVSPHVHPHKSLVNGDAMTGEGHWMPCALVPQGGCHVLSRSGTMGAHKPATISHEMMLPGGSEANGKLFGNYCPSDPLLQ